MHESTSMPSDKPHPLLPVFEFGIFNISLTLQQVPYDGSQELAASWLSTPSARGDNSICLGLLASSGDRRCRTVQRCACGDPPGAHTSVAEDTLWWLATIHKDVHIMHMAFCRLMLGVAAIYRPWQCHSSAWLTRRYSGSR